MSLQSILGIAIPIITFFLMTIVGMDLTSDDFKKIRNTPKAFWVGTFGQYLLPFCAWMVLLLLRPVPEVASGMILIASAPAGGISNYYSYLARVNVALSVVLTTVSCICAAITMPLLLQLFQFLLPQSTSYYVPLKILFKHLMSLLVIPIMIGFAVRLFFPTFLPKYGKILKYAGFIALGILIGFIFYQTWAAFVLTWRNILITATVFIVFSMLLGYILGLMFRLDKKNSFTLLIEYGTRNVAITTATAVIVLQRTEYATFAAIYFLAEALIILPTIAIFKRKNSPQK
ncbi:MAG TPA: bile acid:sodium symporter [Acidobacteriota bacterium]|nr:bile acid:sodium symporter [Acidobacteriota bacterium]